MLGRERLAVLQGAAAARRLSDHRSRKGRRFILLGQLKRVVGDYRLYALDRVEPVGLAGQWRPFSILLAYQQDVTALAVADPELMLFVERRPACGADVAEKVTA